MKLGSNLALTNYQVVFKCQAVFDPTQWSSDTLGMEMCGTGSIHANGEWAQNSVTESGGSGSRGELCQLSLGAVDLPAKYSLS